MQEKLNKKDKGYSLAVLIITISVILIITATVINVTITSKEERNIINFIYDISALEDMCKAYYSENGTIPGSEEVIVPNEMLMQLDKDDGTKYYRVQLEFLEKLNLKEERRYIINEKTLRVYSLDGVEYKGIVYYTITNDLLGIESGYKGIETEVKITGNPIAWTTKAYLIVSLPTYIGNEANITIKVGKGSLVKEDFANNEGVTWQKYQYGTQYVADENGIYTFYISTLDEEIIKKVVVSRIDDINPRIKYNNDEKLVTFWDDETGVKEVLFLAKNELSHDIYKDREVLQNDILEYEVSKQQFISEWQSRYDEYTNLSAEDKALQKEEMNLYREIMKQNFLDLEEEYFYFTNPDEKYMIKVNDMNGNTVSYTGEDEEWQIDFITICNTFDIIKPDFTIPDLDSYII